jgi:Flp pilus assembly protein TadD
MNAAVMNNGTYEKWNEDGIREGEASASDFVFGLSFAFANPAFLPRGWIGVTSEVVTEAVGGSLVGFSTGGIMPVANRFAVGWALLNVGPKAGGFSLPAVIKAGASYVFLPGGIFRASGWEPGTGAGFPPLGIGRLALDVGYGMVERKLRISGGAEYSPIPVLVLRAGYKWRGEQSDVGGMTGLAAGVGFRIGRLGLDYAYQPFGELVTSHRITLLYGLGPVGEAYARYTRPIRPTTVDALRAAEKAAPIYGEAVGLYQTRDFAGARLKAVEAAETDHQLWQAWQLAGSCLYSMGDTTGAIAYYRKSLEVNPQNPELKAALDGIEAARTKPEPQTAVANPDAEYQAAEQLYRAGDYDGAWRRSAAALQVNPRHWQSWQMIGNCQYAKGDKAGAITSYGYSLQLNPDNPSLKAWLDQISK